MASAKLVLFVVGAPMGIVATETIGDLVTTRSSPLPWPGPARRLPTLLHHQRACILISEWALMPKLLRLPPGLHSLMASSSHSRPETKADMVTSRRLRSSNRRKLRKFRMGINSLLVTMGPQATTLSPQPLQP